MEYEQVVNKIINNLKMELPKDYGGHSYFDCYHAGEGRVTDWFIYEIKREPYEIYEDNKEYEKYIKAAKKFLAKKPEINAKGK